MTLQLTDKKQSRPSLAVVVFVLFFALGWPTTAAFAGEILLSNVGSGQWQISSNALINIHVLDLTLRYEPQRLPAVTATVGSGASGGLTALNDKTPGLFRLGIASSKPLPASGVLLKFQSTSPGAELVVTQFTATASDGDGGPIAVTLRQQLPTPTSLPPTTTETETVVATPENPPATTLSPTGPTRLTRIVAGGVVLPGGEATSESLLSEHTTSVPPSLPVISREEKANKPALQPPAVSGPEKRFHSQEEIVTAIERLPKPWTIAAIKAIFLKPATIGKVRQEPVVVLADGKTGLRLYLAKTTSLKKPDIATQGVTLGAIWDAGALGWQVALVTQKNIWPAKALLLGDAELIQFPIVVVPALVNLPRPDNDDVVVPPVDFNGDGDMSAIDAYLYVGNLLVR